MDDNPEIRDRLNVNKSTYHNKRPRERFICFIRGAKWMKINQLNGPSPIHDTSTWLSQSIQAIRHVCCWLGMQKNFSWKYFRTAFGHYEFPVNKCFRTSLTHAQTLLLAVSYVFPFTFFTAAHFYLALVAASISQFVTAASQNFYVVLPTKKCLLRFFISRSKSLSPFFSLSFAGLPPTFSFSLSFSCSIFQICGHDNLSKFNT